MTTIKLGGQPFEVSAPTFGKLRKIIEAFNLLRSPNADSMVQAGIIFGLMIDKTPDEIDAMPINMMEMTEAISQIPEICGIVPSKETGEVPVATASTQSTAI